MIQFSLQQPSKRTPGLRKHLRKRWISKVAQCYVRNPPASAGDSSLIPGSGRSSGERSGNPSQHPRLGNPRQRSLAGYSSWGCERVGHDWAHKNKRQRACFFSSDPNFWELLSYSDLRAVSCDLLLHAFLLPSGVRKTDTCNLNPLLWSWR